MKAVLIGFGHSGRVHLEAMRATAGIAAAAVCDPAPEQRRSAEALGISSYERLEDLLLHEDPDAAVICTPPRGHASAALACMAQGVHVLCEKPMALGSREALAMFAAADRGAVLAVASKFRHVPAVCRAREMITSGEFGELLGFNVSFHAAVDMSGRWHAQPGISGGGVIADNGAHVFDIVSYFFGDLIAVRAIALPARQRLAVEDTAWLQIETGSGVTGSAELSWSQPPVSDVFMTIHGSRAKADIGWKESRVKRRFRDWEPLGGAYDRCQAHRNMHRAFRDAVDDGSDLWITPRECVQAVSAVEACYGSLRSGAWEMISVTGMRAGPAASELATQVAP